MKAALTSTQQGVKAMHSIIQQQHQTASASAAIPAPTLATSAPMHHMPRSTTQPAPAAEAPSKVSDTAAAAASAVAATHCSSGQPLHSNFAGGVAAGTNTQAFAATNRNHFDSLANDTNTGGHPGPHAAAAPLSAWWPAEARAASPLRQQQPYSPRSANMVNSGVAGDGMYGGTVAGRGDQPYAGESRSSDGRHQPPESQVQQTAMGGDGDRAAPVDTTDHCSGVKRAGDVRSESGDSDQLSFDQEVQVPFLRPKHNPWNNLILPSFDFLCLHQMACCLLAKGVLLKYDNRFFAAGYHSSWCSNHC